MDNLKEVVKFVLENEGGFVIDIGGATNYGITAKYLTDNKFFQFDFDKDGAISADDMRIFTRDDAVFIYQTWWYSIRYQDILSLALATRVFDMCVNSGKKTGIRLLQQCCNNVCASNLVEDGILGDKTLKVVNAQLESAMLPAYKSERLVYYRRLASANPGKYGKYLKGWERRAML